MKEYFTKDFISREAGERLRNMIEESEKKQIRIDFSGMTVASVSFLHEGIVRWQENNDSKKSIQLVGIHKMDVKVIRDIAKSAGVEIRDISFEERA